jgi:DNA-binding transcriptional LysR family regulator
MWQVLTRILPTGLSAPQVNLRLLEIFARVAEEGTMSAAAERLEMSQAAVSQAITSLEEAFSVQPFDRSVRPQALTLLGRTALKCTNEAFGKLRELEDTMRYASSGRVPLLRIGMLNSFTSTAGASMLDQLRDLASEWTVVSGFNATTVKALLERRCDAIITSDDGAVPEAVETRLLLTEPYQLAVPANYKGDVADLKAVITGLDFIRYGKDAHMAPILDNYLRRTGIQSTPRYQFDTTDAALRMVEAGFSWTIVTPLIFLKSMVPARTVRVVPLPGPPLLRRVVAAMRRGESGESGEILQRIQEASLWSLREVVLPQITRVLPGSVAEFQIAEATTAAPKRRRKAA